jgi:hypothetical protein
MLFHSRRQSCVYLRPAQARQMCHACHQVDKTHRMADGRLLFRKRLMRLAVGFVFDHPRRAIGVPV